jgi:hypothetical protein
MDEPADGWIIMEEIDAQTAILNNDEDCESNDG